MLTRKSARKFTLAASLALATLGTAVIAAAMDPVVNARQETMGLIGSNVKKLSAMVKGEVAFDAAAAADAFAAISEKAATVPGLFETKSNSDPESEAKDAIWDNWEDFTTKAADLQAAAEVGTLVDSPEALGAAMEALGGACKACHSDYKE